MSTTSNADFEKIIESKEWVVSLSAEAKQVGFSAICESVYAVIGIILSPEVNNIISGWTELQGYMLKFQEVAKGKLRKDLYLVFIVPHIDSSQLHSIEAIINDTHVCRKICIEQRERSIKEALNDCGLIATDLDVVKPKTLESIGQDGNQEISKEILNDLRTRSEKTIFEKLLDNGYESKK